MARILVVEDDGITSSILARSLVRTGHEVEVAENGLAAVDLLEQDDCDLLITDMMMPRLGGQELCEIVRSDQRFADLRMIRITTGVTDDERLSWVTMFQGIEVVAKPIVVASRVERIAELLAD